MKRAYDNWHQVVEYDGKFLNSLPIGNKKEITALAAPLSAQDYTTAVHNIDTAQRRQQYAFSQHDRQLQTENSSSMHQFIELPCVRSEEQTLISLNNNPQPTLSGSLDYSMSAGNIAGGAGCSYFTGDWSRPRNGQGLEDVVAEEIRLRSSEMLENDDMQRLLKTLSMGIGVEMGADGIGHSVDDCYAYSVQYEPQIMSQSFGKDPGKTSGKAVVGWLKLKAALRWGIFVRKRAAQRRARLTEIDDELN